MPVRRLSCKRVVPVCRVFYGRYWARTSDPQLVDSERCSRAFAGVRSRRIVERNLEASERFSEPERTPSVAIVATARAANRPNPVRKAVDEKEQPDM
jgi:hypothetical protein